MHNYFKAAGYLWNHILICPGNTRPFPARRILADWKHFTSHISQLLQSVIQFDWPQVSLVPSSCFRPTNVIHIQKLHFKVWVGSLQPLDFSFTDSRTNKDWCRGVKHTTIHWWLSNEFLHSKFYCLTITGKTTKHSHFVSVYITLQQH